MTACTRNASATDARPAQKQIGEHAQQWQYANDHHPRDSGSRVAMRPKQNARDDRQFEQRDECKSDQRVSEYVYHEYT